MNRQFQSLMQYLTVFGELCGIFLFVLYFVLFFFFLISSFCGVHVQLLGIFLLSFFLFYNWNEIRIANCQQIEFIIWFSLVALLRLLDLYVLTFISFVKIAKLVKKFGCTAFYRIGSCGKIHIINVTLGEQISFI